MVTLITPREGSASAENPEEDRSMMRPGLLPSRSSTTHVVLAPVASLTICNAVPNGSVGLAQPSGGACEYHVASPLSELTAAVVGTSPTILETCTPSPGSDPT